ncbi:thiamine diphosphokinase [Desulfitobacterium sp.]|uniref:thiamine diphosphokinase n=1 Tax=Desulfitobacterium sp. TaxID=49981 RepID=UPI002B1F3783|nr:thiamine diphosphokinase [Desulfitobacterium sp.]MEA4900137.1 thiamine diphosphokinase [Desulfitobacterium sp.]
MKIAVLANGQWDAEWGRLELARFDYLICADGGGNSALLTGRIPDVLIGDLDSITPENLELCRRNDVLIQQYPREKDETDLELALEYALNMLGTKMSSPNASSREMSSLWLYGATGGRVDHLLGNLALLLKFLNRGCCIHIKDPLHEIYMIRGRETLKGRAGQELSIIPVTEKIRVTTDGLFYPLHGEFILKESPRGISNVFLEEQAVVQVEEGIALLVLLT